MAARSDAFLFAKQELQGSNQLEAEVGDIQDVHIPLLGFYREKFDRPLFGSADETVVRATMDITVVGAKKTINLQMEVEKRNGVWSVKQALVDGNSFALTPAKKRGQYP